MNEQMKSLSGFLACARVACKFRLKIDILLFLATFRFIYVQRFIAIVAIVYEKPQKLLKIRLRPRKPPEYCDSQNYHNRNYARAMSSSLSHQHSTRQFST